MTAYLAMIVGGQCVLYPKKTVEPEVTLHAELTQHAAVKNLVERQQRKLRELLNQVSSLQRDHRIALRTLRRLENSELMACVDAA